MPAKVQLSAVLRERPIVGRSILEAAMRVDRHPFGGSPIKNTARIRESVRLARQLAQA